MNRFVQFQLTRCPKLYRQLLLWKNAGRVNDKVIFLSLIKNGDTIFDVGANVGDYTNLFSHLAGKNGEVHAFEPVPATFNNLSSNVKSHATFDNVRLNNLAVGETVSTAEIYQPGTDHGQASLAKHDIGAWSDAGNIITHQVNVTTLDEYAKAINLTRLDFMKIDIEGHELMCLRGGQQTISSLKPVLYLELFSSWSKDFGYTAPDLVSYLQSLGYDKFYLITDTVKALSDPLKEVRPDVLSVPANLVCGVNGRHQFEGLDSLSTT